VASLLRKARTIAIVGLSDTPTRDSHSVALYMMEKGYKIIPVNPNCSEILGEKSYPDLLSIPDNVDIVDIFRKTEFIPEIVMGRCGKRQLGPQTNTKNPEIILCSDNGAILQSHLCYILRRL